MRALLEALQQNAVALDHHGEPMIASARAVVRWISVPIATVLAMVMSAILLSLLIDVLSRLSVVRDGADVVAGLQGGIVAWVTLATASAVAPTQRRLVVLFAFLCGTWAAWRVLGNWYFPEHHVRAYQASRLPLTMTLVSGLVCMVAFWLGAPPLDEARHRGPRVI